MNAVELDARGGRVRRRLPALLLPLAAVVAFAFVVVGIARASVDVRKIDRVTFVNETPYALDVDVTNAQQSGWVRLGIAERGVTTTVTDVVDQGDEWTFRFAAQGLDGGELHFRRSDLVGAQWRVVVSDSDSVAARLRAQGAPPTPARTDADPRPTGTVEQ